MKNPDAESLLRKLVSLPSVAPPQTDRSGEIGGGARMADIFAGLMADLGFAIEHRELLPGRSDNLPATPRGRTGVGTWRGAPGLLGA